MDYKGTLIAVKDMGKAKQFYCSLLGLEVIMDAGANVELTGGVFLQTSDTWVSFIRKAEKEIIYADNAIELYFETNDIDSFQNKLSNFSDIIYLHPLLEHSWGQRAVRFYVPDGHIIEVVENMAMVVKKFIASGLSIDETAKRTDVDANYIKSCLEQ